MEFRLTYEGPLYASQPSKQYCPEVKCPLKQNKALKLSTHKQNIRKHFHRQIKVMWEKHPVLSEFTLCKNCGIDTRPLCKPDFAVLGGHEHIPVSEYLASNHIVGDYSLVPLVAEEFGVTCSVDVLLFQHGHHEGVFKAGDLDNRIKTLIDGLKKPLKVNAFGDHKKPTRTEKPFFCLLEDDSMISSFSVKSDQFFATTPTQKDEHYVKAVLAIKVRPSFPTQFNLAFI